MTRPAVVLEDVLFEADSMENAAAISTVGLVASK
jgi:hypothetical protein